MKNLIVIPAMLFIIFFCCFFNFTHLSKEELMNSWAWKIFIFTDEGEFMPTESAQNNFEDTTKVKPIFVEDVLEIYSKDVLSFNNQKELLKYPLVFADYGEGAIEK